MNVQVVATPYGSPAVQKLAEQVAKLKNGNPLSPVTVVIPTPVAGLATRRALGARGRGIAAVSFLMLFDLAAKLVGQAQTGLDDRKLLTNQVIAATVRKVLNADPGIFRDSAHHPATEQALVQAYQELRELPEEGHDRLAAQSGRAADVVRICRQARSELHKGWYDQTDQVELAVEALQSFSPEAAGVDDKPEPVVVFLPQRVTPSQGAMVSALGTITSVVVIAGLTGDEAADGPVRDSVRRMGSEIGSQPSIPKPCGQRVISTASADDEMRVVVREVVDAARHGIPLSRVALLCGGGTPSLRHLHDHLTAAEIEFNGPNGRTLADSLVGRGLLALLDLKRYDFRRTEVFALLSVAAPILHQEPAGSDEEESMAAGRRPMPASAWERVSRQAGVTRGAQQWTERLERFAAEQRERLERFAAEQADMQPSDPDYRAETMRRDAAHADSLAQFMVTLIEDLTPDPEPSTWKEWCDWISKLIATYLNDEQDVRDWPEPEREAARKIKSILDRLATLGEIEPRPRSATLRHALTTELLGTTIGRIGRVGQGVFTGRIGDSLGMELDRVILIGMAEGVFPRSLRDDPLLPERERQIAGDELTRPSGRIDEQHRHFLTALASADEATLVYARGDTRRSAEQHPSRWLLDTATALAGRPVDSASLEGFGSDRNAGWFEHVSSFWGRVRGDGPPATDQEFCLQALTGHRASDPAEVEPISPEVLELLGDDPFLIRGAEMVTARASERFTRFDGNLTGHDVTDFTGVMSPTSLETWADCPMRYLFRHVFRVQPVEQPEELLEISALDKGSLVHEALEEFIAEALREGRVPEPNQPWNEQQRRRLREIGEEKCRQMEERGLTGAPVYWHHERHLILADLDRFLTEDDKHRREQRTTPIAAELSFGMTDADTEAVPVMLPSGREVKLKGQIDRVDRTAGGGLVVTDYKTGKADSYTKLNKKGEDLDPVIRGTRLQLPVYGLAAQAHSGHSDAPVEARYWFVTGKEKFKTHGYELDGAVLSRFKEVMEVIAGGIGAGVFCDRPEAEETSGSYSQFCDYCNPDRLGTEDARRCWDKMENQDELLPYRLLAEPHKPEPEPEDRTSTDAEQ